MRLSLIASLLLAACGGGGDDQGAPDAAPVGRICFIPLDAGAPTLIASPALDCPSRDCLHVAGSTGSDLCTAPCNGDDGDCAESAESACTGGMRCVIPLDQGPFACQRFCVCSDQLPTGGFTVTCP